MRPYQSGDLLTAVNRPAAEDDPEIADFGEIKKFFGDLPLQMLQDRRVDTGQLQGEIWRLFLFFMLLLLLSEGLLILPGKRPGPAKDAAPMKTAPQPKQQRA
jgi:hypothetical protein